MACARMPQPRAVVAQATRVRAAVATAAGGGGRSALALRAEAAPAPSRLDAAQARALTHARTRNRAVLETIAEGRPSVPSPRESLRAVDADALLRALNDGSVPWNVRNVNYALRVCGAHARFEEAVQLLTRLTRTHAADAYTYVALITAAGQQRNMKAAFAVFDAMQRAGMPRGEAAYGALMQACVRALQLERAFQVLCDAEAAGVALTPVLFTHLIVGCIHAGEYDRAFQVYHHMRTHHCLPDAVTYTAIISACAKMDQPEKAVGVLTEMRHMGVDPTHVTYNVVMHACARSFRRHAMAHDLFREMAAAGHTHDAYSFNAALLACSHAGEIQRAREYMWEMHRHGVAPTSVTLNTLLAVYARSLAPNHAALPKPEDAALAVRGEGKELLKPAAELPPSRRVLGEHGRIIAGDQALLVDALLADYFAESTAKNVDPEEEKIVEASRDDANANLPSMADIGQDTASLDFRAARDYLLRERIVTKELVADIERLNTTYPALDSDAERAEDRVMAMEEQDTKREARAHIQALGRAEAAMEERQARVNERAEELHTALSAPTDEGAATHEGGAPLTASQAEAVERVLSGRLVFDEVVARVNGAGTDAPRTVSRTQLATLPDGRLSLQAYMRQLEADIDAELGGSVLAPTDATLQPGSSIGGQSLEQIFDVSSVPPPAASDTEGDVDPLVLHDHYARIIADRVSSAIDKELSPEFTRLVEAGSEWSDAEALPAAGPGDVPALPAPAATPPTLVSLTSTELAPVAADRLSAAASLETPRVGSVRRRRSGSRPGAEALVHAHDQRSVVSDAAQDVRENAYLVRNDEAVAAPDDASASLHSEAAAPSPRAAFDADAFHAAVRDLRTLPGMAGAPLTSAWPKRGTPSYERTIRDAISHVRGSGLVEAPTDAALAAGPSLRRVRQRVLARVLRAPMLHPVDAALVSAAETPGKHRKREVERAQPGFVDVMLAARRAGTASEDAPVATSREASRRVDALQRMSAGLLEGARWIPRDAAHTAPQDRRAVIVEEARRIFDTEFDAVARPRDVVTLNTMLAVYCNAGRADAATRFLAEEFPKYSVAPDARTFRALVRMYVRGHDVERAEEALRQAEAMGVHPDADTLGSLVHAYARAWRLKDAIAIVQRMKSSGMKCAEPYAFLLRQRCKELGIQHADVPAHALGWQYTPQVMRKRRATGRVLNKVVAYALRPKMAGGWRA